MTDIPQMQVIPDYPHCHTFNLLTDKQISLDNKLQLK